MNKRATTDYAVNDLIAERWSPTGFDERAVSEADLCAVFEAARWAPSSYNAQPWHYIVARKAHKEDFARVLSCLVEANQTWAKYVPVLALGVTRTNFSYNGKPNKAAFHDLGLAAGNICLEATARGLHVHQMIGIMPERARELYEIPEEFEPLTALAIGYWAGPDAGLPDAIRERDRKQRERKPLREFVFSGSWAQASDFLGQ